MPAPVVFITGASSGLGEALARRHAAQGHRVVLFARRSTSVLARELTAAGAEGVLAFRGDVTRRADLDRAVGATLKRFGGLDIVYANAGFGLRGRLDDLDLARWRKQQAVNVEGLLSTVWATLPALKVSRGRLGLVGSVLGFGVVPGNGAYAASKFAVRAVSQALYAELKSDSVSVTHIAPGFFESQFRGRDDKGKFDPQAPDTAPQGWRISAAEAAAYAADAVWHRKREVIFPLHGRITALLFRFFPALALSLAGRARARALASKKP